MGYLKLYHYSSGKKSPEQLLIDYAEELFINDDSFWVDRVIIDKGYGKHYYIDNVQRKVQGFKDDMARSRENSESTKGKTREFNKKLFIDNKNFFELLFKHWIHNPINQAEVNRFYEQLHILFVKVAHYHEINPNEWIITT